MVVQARTLKTNKLCLGDYYHQQMVVQARTLTLSWRLSTSADGGQARTLKNKQTHFILATVTISRWWCRRGLKTTTLSWRLSTSVDGGAGTDFKKPQLCLGDYQHQQMMVQARTLRNHNFVLATINISRWWCRHGL